MDFGTFEIEDNIIIPDFPQQQSNDQEIINKRLDILEKKLDKITDLLYEKITLSNDIRIYFYNPSYSCKDDLIHIKDDKIFIKVTLIGMILNIPVKLYIHNAPKCEKLKMLCYDFDNKLMLATFIASPNEDDCFLLRNPEMYDLLKFPLTFVRNIN